MPLSDDAKLVGGSIAVGFGLLNATLFRLFASDPASLGAYLSVLFPILFAIVSIKALDRSSESSVEVTRA